MARRNGKDVVGEGSDHEDDAESLRLQLRKLLRSLQEKNEIIDELQSRHNQHENEAREFTSVDDTPLPRESRRCRRRRNEVQDEWQNKYNPRFDIPEFEGKINVDDFIDWLNIVERIFDFHEPPEQKKVKLVALKLRRNASFWWENLKKQREREGKSKIVTWEKMKRELKRKYLPHNYRQEIFLKIHDFKQKDLSVEEYTA